MGKTWLSQNISMKNQPAWKRRTSDQEQCRCSVFRFESFWPKLPGLGRKFTWSNDTTQTRIDRAFSTMEWDMMLPMSNLQAISSLVSDHSPLLLVGSRAVQVFRGSRFESFWPKLPRFWEIVQEVRNQSLSIFNPFLKLHTEFSSLFRLHFCSSCLVFFQAFFENRFFAF
jgi:hypothetical protein